MSELGASLSRRRPRRWCWCTIHPRNRQYLERSQFNSLSLRQNRSRQAGMHFIRRYTGEKRMGGREGNQQFVHAHRIGRHTSNLMSLSSLTSSQSPVFFYWSHFFVHLFACLLATHCLFILTLEHLDSVDHNTLYSRGLLLLLRRLIAMQEITPCGVVHTKTAIRAVFWRQTLNCTNSSCTLNRISDGEVHSRNCFIIAFWWNARAYFTYFVE